MFPICYEDNSLLAINKPAGLSTESGSSAHPSAEHDMRAWLHAQMPQRREPPYLRAVHRLDRVTSGLLLLAKRKTALSALMRQFELHQTRKTYRAIAPTYPEKTGLLSHSLYRSEDGRRALVGSGNGAQEALLAYQIVQELPGGMAEWELRPQTGRFHQIRAQLSHIGCPIIGDVDYGGAPWQAFQIKLHALRLECVHPDTGNALVLEAPLPDNWRAV